jgi:hypothetical protein
LLGCTCPCMLPAAVAPRRVIRPRPTKSPACLCEVLCLVCARLRSMWTPNITTPVVRMLCHHGPVRAVALDAPGRHLVTTGADGQVGRRGWGGVLWEGPAWS